MQEQEEDTKSAVADAVEAEPSKGSGRSIRYIVALDGIRALSVIAVILYHLRLSGAQGGFIGVTVFFVLSGFLITKLLLTEFSRTRTIDFKGFYMRRVKRLFPAIVTVIVVTGAACAIFNHVLLTKMRPDVIPTLLFVNNWWQIFNDASYFQNLGLPSPLTHFWSVSIEEQFYLIAPALLFLALRKKVKRKHIAVAVLVLAALSVLEMVLLYDPSADATRVYYGTDTRASSLLIGMFLALVTSGKRPRLETKIRQILGAVGLAGLVVMCVVLNGSMPFTYNGGLVVCSALAAMLIYSVIWPDKGALHTFLASKPMVWIGKRSYGIYLWHYPIILLLTPQNMAGSLPALNMLLAVALTFGLSALSYTFIETPIRKGVKPKIALPSAVSSKLSFKMPAKLSAAIHAKKSEPAVQPKMRHAKPKQRKKLKLLVDPVTTGVVAVCAAVAIVGFIAVPDTSAISEEGQALLDAGSAVGTGRGADGAPAAQDDAAFSADSQSTSSDPRTEAQIAFDAKLAATPLPEGAYDVVMIGDSVSLRTVPYFEEAFPNGYIDAEINRRLEAGLEVYDGLNAAGEVGNIVILSLGTNGYITDDQIDEAVEAIGTDKAIWFLTVRNPYEGMAITNEALMSAQERYPNVRVIDWVAESEGHDEYFDGDGEHLSEEGAQIYIGLIKDAIKNQRPAAS